MAQPTGLGVDMLFTTFQPNALAVELEETRCGLNRENTISKASGCVDVFAASSAAGDALTLRLVNSGNASQLVDLRLLTADGRRAAVTGAADLLSLTSPLSDNQTAFAEAQGGVNPVYDPLRISAQRATVPVRSLEAYVLPPQAFHVLQLRMLPVGKGETSPVVPPSAGTRTTK
eukprot:CAMPEP_0119387314 /NCGR_PEP_ID=MMETSP1334-20130426/100103_1 /TAXON_ID=127549 /ORGANISM="Calcidiscus leptoporus, Strain RCC1130" /LENGTH=173 /DNA_ID=CAMNT_0007409017 /DNA_START=5 /DNA_END=527 /DNA_ORIENTATION=-